MPKTALIFPGQGSQYIGMGKDLLQNFSNVSPIFEEASDAIGVDLKTLSFEGPEDQLNRTANTQPAILTASIAALEVLKSETGITGELLAGHSLGEYTALVHSGVFSYSDAVRIVRKRGELMQAAVPEGEGAMAAIIGMDDDDVVEICSEAAGDDVVSAANFNSPGQVVISGQKIAVDRALVIAKEKGAKRAIPLPVSAPSHCSLMKEAGKELNSVIEDLNMGDLGIPVVSNVDALSYPSVASVSGLLARQLISPVRWVDSVLHLKKEGAELIIEVGPGRVLSGLIKRIDRGLKTLNVEDTESLKKVRPEQ